VRKEPDWQVFRLKPEILVPVRLVVEALVAKKLVEVAWVVVALLETRPPVKVEEALLIKPPVRVRRPVASSAVSDLKNWLASRVSRVPVQSPVASRVMASPEQLIPVPSTSEQSKEKSLARRVMPAPPVALVSSEMSSLFLVMVWPVMVM